MDRIFSSGQWYTVDEIKPGKPYNTFMYKGKPVLYFTNIKLIYVDKFIDENGLEGKMYKVKES